MFGLLKGQIYDSIYYKPFGIHVIIITRELPWHISGIIYLILNDNTVL